MAPATASPYKGVFPVAPTPFLENGDLDLEGQRRVLDCMIDQGVDGICILANYSEQFLLTDEERDTLTELCLAHVARSCARDRHHQSLQHAHRRGACPQGGRGGRAHADADAALSRRRPAGGREGDGGAFRPRRRSGRHSHHDSGRALERRSPLARLPRPPRPGDSSRALLQDRGSAGSGHKLRAPDRDRRRRHRRTRSTARNRSR